MKTLNFILATAASLLLMFSMSALAQTSGSSTTSSDQSSMGSSSKSSHSSGMSAKSGGADEMFVKKAAQGSKAEVELGQLALQKASSDDVKKFAQRMVDDHTKAGQELQSAVSSKGMTLPDQPDAKEQAEKERLSKLDGPAFDKAYMAHMVKDHQKDVAEFRKEANNGKDQAVKAFAFKTLPTLEDHLKQAKSVDQSVKGSKSAQSENGATPSQSASNKKSKSY